MTNEELVSVIQNMHPLKTPKLSLPTLDESANFILFLLDRGAPDVETSDLISGFAHLLYFAFDETTKNAQPEYYKFAERFKFNTGFMGKFVAAKVPVEHWSDLLADVLKYYRECALNKQGPDDASTTYQDLARRRSLRRRELRDKGYLQLDDPDLGR